jgi:heptosyltransferase-1
VLGYSLSDMPLDYGLASEESLSRISEQYSDKSGLPKHFVIFLHAASTPDKEWPVKQWISLGNEMNQRGLSVLLPWGDEREKGNAQSIADGLQQAVVLPRLGLNDLASLIVKAEVLVGEDSGLSHMAAALGRPIVALYLVTDPALTGVMGSGIGGACRVKNLQVKGEAQDIEKVVNILDEWLPAGY